MCPDFISPENRNLESLGERSLLLWAPTKKYTNNKLEAYINYAESTFNYNIEHALSVLFLQKNNFDNAKKALDRYKPRSDEWTESDKKLFNRAFKIHGKNFHEIRKL